jgi:hypothetical protein
LGLVAAADLLIGGAIIYDFYDRWAFARRSPIAVISKEDFQQRILARFPLGSSASDLIRELTAQGFQHARFGVLPERWALDEWQPFRTDSKRVDGWLILSPGPGISLVCRFSWSVIWQVDASKQITAIHAERGGICL